MCHQESNTEVESAVQQGHVAESPGDQNLDNEVQHAVESGEDHGLENEEQYDEEQHIDNSEQTLSEADYIRIIDNITVNSISKSSPHPKESTRKHFSWKAVGWS